MRHATRKGIFSDVEQTFCLGKGVWKSKSKQTEFFVHEVKDKRMTKNGPEFHIGWCDFPLEKDDTWEPITNLTGNI